MSDHEQASEDERNSEEGSEGSSYYSSDEEEVPPYSAPPVYKAPKVESQQTQTPLYFIEEAIKREREARQIIEAKHQLLQKEFQSFKSLSFSELESKILLLHNQLNKTLELTESNDKEQALQRATKAESELRKALEGLQKAYELLKEKDEIIRKKDEVIKAKDEENMKLKSKLDLTVSMKSDKEEEVVSHTPRQHLTTPTRKNSRSIPRKKSKSLLKEREPEMLKKQINDAKQWMEMLLEIHLGDDLLESLRTGVELCNLINKIKPRSIPSSKINKMKINFMYIENINNFLQSCEKLGVITFHTDDLLEGKNVQAVVDCILDLKKKYNNNS